MGQCLSFHFHLQNFNDVAHMPVLEDLGLYTFWWCAWYFTPFLAALIFLHDVFTGWWFACDTGFGRTLTHKLAKRGYKVYAACLTQKACDDIKAEAEFKDLVVPIQMDVTKEAQVMAAMERIDREHPQGIWALVNNAGVSRSGLIDWMSLEDYRFVMECNFFGLLSVSKIFIESLKKGKGRIVNISSVTGVACGYPLSSAYSCSKHAMEVLTSTLRQEVKPWGITVSTINPGFHRTPMNDLAASKLQDTYNRQPEEIKAQYGDDFLQGCLEVTKTFTQEKAFNPKHVINAMVHAVTSTRPKVQYRVGVDCKFGLVWTQVFPLRIGEAIIYGITTNAKMRKVKGLPKEQASKETA